MTSCSDRISVIVPVYNDWHRIPRLLGCLKAQTLPVEQFEILLIDNGSDRFEPPQNLASNVRILHCDMPGSYAARNHGIEQACGHWLAFTDADCLPASDWLAQALATGDNSAPMTILAGQVRMIASSAHPSAWEMHDLVKGIPQDWYVSRGYAATANLFVPAGLARQLRGFDAARYSGADADFCRRAVATGARLAYVDAAVVEHPARTTWPELAGKYRRIKGGQVTQGTTRQRLVWTVRTFLPPVIAWARFLRAGAWPIRYRLTACMVQMRLWAMEIVEILRLALRAGPQR